MPVGAESCHESTAQPFCGERVVLSNLELNRACAWSVACSACYLQKVAVDRPVLADALILEAAKAMIRQPQLRHLAIPGMEPLQSPSLLRESARAFHDAPADQRPASVGVISASIEGIKKWLPRFADAPLSWLAVSVDSADSGLRGGDAFKVLEAAKAGRAAGGVGELSVNSTFQEHTMEVVLGFAKRLSTANLAQWAICALAQPMDDEMRSSVTADMVARMIEKAAVVVDVAEKVVVETDPATLRALLGEETWRTVDTRKWRIEVRLPSGVWLFARAPEHGFFVRMRYDGQLLSRQDFARLNLLEGRYGQFREAEDINRAFAMMSAERAALSPANASSVPSPASTIAPPIAA